jgi:hypothetical protein
MARIYGEKNDFAVFDEASASGKNTAPKPSATGLVIARAWLCLIT